MLILSDTNRGCGQEIETFNMIAYLKGQVDCRAIWQKG